MSTVAYPVRVDATLEPGLSRWLWLVKWLLAIPHYVVLAFLWLAFAVLTPIAFVAILFTGRYPRGIFEFNVGVLRWSWRVGYYTYGGLATDRYPPFTLHDVADYPARLEVPYPSHLSRGLVLVKWWLLALPHYLVLTLFLGGGWYAADAAGQDTSPALWGSGLIGLLVFFAGVVLLFRGVYPRSLYDFVLGMDRWALRVAAYVGLMTDAYPPFRLDLGGNDPGSRELLAGPPAGGGGAAPAWAGSSTAAGTTVATRAGPEAPATDGNGHGGGGQDRALATPVPAVAGAAAAGTAVVAAVGSESFAASPGTTAGPPVGSPAPGSGGGGASAAPARTGAAPPEPTEHRWSAGRVLAVVLGALLFLLGGGLLTAGLTLGLADNALREDGYLMTSTTSVSTPGAAVVSPSIRLESFGGALGDLLGDARVTGNAGAGQDVFIGVASTSDVSAYLADAGYSRWVDAPADSWSGGPPTYRYHQGGPLPTAPTDTPIWVASSSGPGSQSLTWPVEDGRWTIVVANPDGGRGVAADVAVGASLPALGWLWGSLAVSGLVLLLLSGVVLFLALRRRSPA